MQDDLSASMLDARRCHNALAIALLIQDSVAALVAATRLRAALHTARTQARAQGVERSVDGISWATAHLLERAPTRLRNQSEIQRLMRWLDAVEANRHSGYGPDLVGVAAEQLRLDRTTWTGLSVVDARLAETNLFGAMFDECHITSSDLRRAYAVRTTWRHARITRSNLTGALFTDAVLDGAVFEDCDLRRARLGTERPRVEAPILCAHFVRCDLRDTSWDRRFVGGAKLLQCKVFGMHGAAVLDGVEIAGADGSQLGDGSSPISPREVIRSWRS